MQKMSSEFHRRRFMSIVWPAFIFIDGKSGPLFYHWCLGVQVLIPVKMSHVLILVMMSCGAQDVVFLPYK